VSYALQALILIRLESNPDRYVPVAELSERLLVSEDQVREQLEALRRLGQVVTCRSEPEGVIVSATVPQRERVWA
jgi:DNA-binding IscR family transcriptional regulator